MHSFVDYRIQTAVKLSVLTKLPNGSHFPSFKNRTKPKRANTQSPAIPGYFSPATRKRAAREQHNLSAIKFFKSKCAIAVLLRRLYSVRLRPFLQETTTRSKWILK